MFSDLFIGVVLSLLLGALIGIQREIRVQKERIIDFAGFRTFTFVSLLGFLIGYLSFEVLDEMFIVIISIFNVFVIAIITYYVISKADATQIRATSEIVFVLTFILGIFISLKYYYLAISLAIIITTILVLGHKLHYFAKHLKNVEFFATLKFAIISIVILPLLPNKNYSLLDFPLVGDMLLNQSMFSVSVISKLDVFNFYNIWLMVVFISAIAFVGYIMMKVVGAERGMLLTGFLGGFMSSTALTITFSQESRLYRVLSNPLAIGVIVACSTMFFRVLFEILIINSSLISGVFISMTLMGIAGFVYAFVLFFKHRDDKHVNKLKLKSPFTLVPALKFAILYLVIVFFSKLFIILNGEKGIFILSFISGITDVDAITISLCNLALDGSISNYVAQMGILIAAMSNTIFKGFLAYYFGSKNFFMKIMFAFGGILLIGGISMLL